MTDKAIANSSASDRGKGRELIKNKGLFIKGRRVPILSGEIQFFRMEPEAWDHSLFNLKAAGIPIVSTYLSWRRFSTGPDSYDLEGRTDPRLDVKRFLNLCIKHGLWVTLKPGPWICAEEANGGYPDWLVKQSQLQVRDNEGAVVLGYNPPFASPIPSYLHPDYLKHVKKWISQVDEYLADYFYPNGPIILVQLDNEPGMTFHDKIFESDYNEVNVGAGGHFHNWLRQKYISIESLNRRYRSAWGGFTEVPAPRALSLHGLEELPAYFDWVEFKEFLLSKHVEMIGDMHLAKGINQVLFTINYNEHPVLSVPNNFAMLELVSGMGGFDYYPRMPLSDVGLRNIALFVGYSRACNVIPWSPEIMSGIWSFKGQEYDPGKLEARDFEFLFLSCVAWGLKGMNFYMFADRDNWIQSPLTASGLPSANLESVQSTVKLIVEEPDFEQFDRRQAVAILYYRPYARESFIAAGSKTNHLKDDWPLGAAYKQFEQVFECLHQLNLDPAVVDPWLDSQDWGKHQIIFVPAGPYMDLDCLKSIQRFSEKGGSVVWCGAVPTLDLDFQPLPNGIVPVKIQPLYLSGSISEDAEKIKMVLASHQISPEVSVSTAKVFTVVHHYGSKSWLFVINGNNENVSAELYFRNKEIFGIKNLIESNDLQLVTNKRVTVVCEAMSVQVWDLKLKEP
jgi:hypothetical protein